MRNSSLVALVVGLVAAFASGASASSSTANANVITSLRYQPKPVYDDDFHMVVSFTTAKRAPAGKHYVVYLNIWTFSTDQRPSDCNSLATSDDPTFGGSRKRRMVGGPGKTERVTLYTTAVSTTTGVTDEQR